MKRTESLDLSGWIEQFPSIDEPEPNALGGYSKVDAFEALMAVSPRF